MYGWIFLGTILLLMVLKAGHWLQATPSQRQQERALDMARRRSRRRHLRIGLGTRHIRWWI